MMVAPRGLDARSIQLAAVPRTLTTEFVPMTMHDRHQALCLAFKVGGSSAQRQTALLYAPVVVLGARQPHLFMKLGDAL